MADVAGWAVMHALWQGALLWLLLEVSLRRLGRSTAEARIRIAEGTLILAVAVSLVTVWSVAARLGIWSELSGSGPEAAPSFETLDPDSGAQTKSLLAMLKADAWPRLVLEETGISRSLRRASSLVGIAWLLGVVWWVARFVRASRWLAEIRRSNHGSCEAEILQRSSELAGRIGLRRAISIVESDWVSAPVVAGFARPTIVLPRKVKAFVSPEQLDAALLHELVHVRRGDQVRIVLYTIVRALYFFHPLLKAIVNRLELECEIACDGCAADALGSRQIYASALVRFQELTCLRERALLLARVSGPRGELRARIQSLLGAAGDKPRPRPVVGSLLFSVAVFAITAGSPLTGDLQEVVRGVGETGSRLWMTAVGQFDLAAGRLDAISLEAGGRLVVEERRSESTLRLDLTGRPDAPPAFEFYRGGTPALFDDDARSWLEGILSREAIAAAVAPGRSADRRLGIEGRVLFENGDAVSIVVVGSRDDQAGASLVILELVAGMVEQRARTSSQMIGNDSELREVLEHLVSHGLLEADEASGYRSTN